MSFRSFFNRFPYTDFHELNLDFILSRLGRLDDVSAKIDDAERIVEEASQIVETVTDASEDAIDAKNAAQASQTAAAGSATAASQRAAAALASQTAAETARTAAQTAQSGAESARTAAQTAKSGAETARNAAQASQTAAANSATSAQNYYNNMVSEGAGFIKSPTNRKWLCFADSYGAFDDSFTKNVQNRIGSDRFVYRAQSGMRYNLTSMTDRYGFSTMLDTWLSGISDKTSYTDILVELGVNDMDGYNASAVSTGFNQAIVKLHQNFPNAHIHCGIFAKSMVASKWRTYTVVVSLLRELAGNLGTYCSWIEGSDRVMGCHDETVDLLHPTTAMHNTIARSIISYMSCYNLFTDVRPEVTTSVKIGGQTLNVTEEYNNGKYTIFVNGGVGGGIALPADGKIVQLGTTNLPLIHRSVSVTGWISTYLYFNGQTFRLNIPGTLLFIPNDSTGVSTIYLCASYTSFYRDSNGDAIPWQDGISVERFTFSGAQVSIPA